MATNSHAVEKALAGGLRSLRRDIPDAGNEILRDFKEVVSTGYPPASSPGTPPHRRTGGYMTGLAVRSRGNKITVYARGEANNKAVWLEFGTRKMRPRPHWRTRLPRIAGQVLPRTLGAALVRGEIR